MIIIGIIIFIIAFLGLWLGIVKYEKQIKSFLPSSLVVGSWVIGLPIVIGGLVFVISGLLFCGIAEEIGSRDLLTLMDNYLNQWFFSRPTPRLTQFMLFISTLASSRTVFFWYLFLVVILFWKKLWYELIFLSFTIPGGMLLTHILKVAFHRPRPMLHQFFSSSLDYSFPSGHVMNATILYGALSIVAISVIREWRWQVLLVLFSLFIVLLVALSRVYLGYHYLSDTLGAITIGAFWLSICFIAMKFVKQENKAP